MCDDNKPVLTDPAAIEAESFRIIDAELPPHFRMNREEHAVVRRVIHATGDFDFARLLRFAPGCFEAFADALRAGAPIVTDTAMGAAGISREPLKKRGNQVVCLSHDAKVAEEAKAEGVTQSIVAMRHAAALAPKAVVVIGNAPTALLEVQRLIILGKWTPALLVAMPVGFVAAEESKHALEHGHAGDVPYITCLGRKGGTPAAVATVNALLRLYAEE